MTMQPSIFFLLGFCLLLVHEMDAIRCAEWRIFPITSGMSDRAGYLLFTALHVPLYALLLWGLAGGGDATRRLIIGLDAFFILHLLLHLLIRNLPNNRFDSAFSRSLIVGAGTCGALDLLLMR